MVANIIRDDVRAAIEVNAPRPEFEAEWLSSLVRPMPQIQRTVRSIRVEGSQRLEPETVISYTQLRVGGRYDHDTIDTAIIDLLATDILADVEIQGIETGELVIRIRENPIINRVILEASKRLRKEEVERELDSQPRQIFTRSRISKDVARIVDGYRRDGFIVAVEPKLVSLDHNRVDLIFDVAEKARPRDPLDRPLEFATSEPNNRSHVLHLHGRTDRPIDNRAVLVDIFVDTAAPLDARGISDLVAAFENDLRANALVSEWQGVTLLHAYPSSWYLRVGVPVAGLAISAAALTNDLVQSLFTERPKVVLTLDTLNKIAQETGARALEVKIDGQRIELDIETPRSKMLEEEMRRRRAAAVPPVPLPNKGDEQDGWTRFRERHPCLTPITFTGTISDIDIPLVSASEIANYPFPYFDWRRPPRSLPLDSTHRFDALLRFDAVGSVIGAFIRTSRPVKRA